ncbi:TPA: TrkA family potassium uptake protein [Streptococcus suis]|uniref:potassium channel family protein n=1 Tax=Streptococcus parasuis TaxID=1501662 RepID=UPI001568A2D7|nr:TrkA family potassium uptake protein [Streptococcus parasuis]WDN58925.1 TrkA family potassium uptake protein [Streptococcus parasuis]WDN60778.1 TrkA family potassium uptake protein [Streptococcus parasuis]HEM3616632.1 TrkA family potassium uptake protein [Streptococcus suis]HEM3674565.1 TrkA family potassium uptake protein [Streptococcus suis]
MSTYTIGILGLGVFGTTIAKTLHKYDCNIIAVDNHEHQINQLESILTRGVVGDITDRSLLRAAGIENCDAVVVATGNNLESSVLAVMHSKMLGVPKIIAKVKGTTTKEILLRIGADKVISPERETGISLAKHLIHRNTTSVFELGGNASIVEFRPPKKWFGKTLAELQLRQNYKMNIIGYRSGENQELNIQLTPDYVFNEDELITAVTDHNTIDHFEDLTD